ncbi:MAG: asparagine synthase (glutamine-hydrolyzing) [Deltaproteobacteria bacterium]|nr:asparagine synthase (glutamine-hydrolyzing) [Deltaproteobacteria bacterium]
MCGIAGILSFNGEAPPVQKLSTMGRTLAHRGPDGAGLEILGPCGLAHRRLSIIDLSATGHQPMSTRDRGLWLTYNGEVYNYLELKEELQKLGSVFASTSDSEVILEAYRAWGLGAFERFNGMWALAIWDVAQQTLILSRDRLGVKPLYFRKSDHRLIFASEIKALLAAEPELVELDEATMAEFVEYPVVGSGTHTYFKGVERFEPGTWMRAQRGGAVDQRRYWTFRPPPQPIEVSEQEAASKVRDLLADSVRLRFRSDVPVGTCLSGGLDSSSIVALAKLRLGKAPESFSVVYDQPGFEEGRFIDVMVERMGLVAHRTHPDASDLPEVMERSGYFQEEPTAGPGIYSQWHVMQLAHGRVKVLLDGQGSDEIFGGYFPYFDAYVDALKRRAKHLDLEAIRELSTVGPKIKELTGKNSVHIALDPRTKLERLETKLRRRAAYGRNIARASLRGWLGGSPFLTSLLRPDPPQNAAAYSFVNARIRPGFVERRKVPRLTGDPLTDLLWDQTTRTSIPGLLHYEDRNSMAFSIEARVPFLDYRLVEYAFQLPHRSKLGQGRTKAVLRDAMDGILPEPIRQRKDKKGYPTPFSLWLRQPRHHEWALDLLLSPRVRQRGLWNPKRAQSLWDDHLADRADNSWPLWQIMSSELFLRRFVDGPFRPEPPPKHAVAHSEHSRV